MTRKILLTLASLFLIGQSYKLAVLIPKLGAESWGAAIFLGWLISLFITGIFAFAGFAWPTQRLMPEAYYKVYYPKRLKRIGKALNIELFRKMLLATLWKNRERQKEFFDGTKDRLENLETQSKKSEFGHLIPFIIIQALSVYWFTIGLIKLGIATFVFNIAGNIYPVILQRNHRMRIQVMKRRLQSKSRV